MAPRALRICILWPGGGCPSGVRFRNRRRMCLAKVAIYRGCQLLQLYAFFSSWPAYCNFLLRLSSLLEVLSDINCAASFLDNCRQVSMADRSAWRQRSWTRNALPVVKIDRALAWEQIAPQDQQE